MLTQTRRILCVDDEEDIRKLLKSLLNLYDLEVVCVKDRQLALLLMENEQFSLYIIDSELPGVSGKGMCEEIRRRDPNTPIIIFSGRGRASDINAGMLAGANVYIVKPLISEIIPTVRRLLLEAHDSSS